MQAAQTAPALVQAATAAASAPTGAVDTATASAVAQEPAQLVAPQPAQPTPIVRVEAAHKQLKSYLPGELCEAFRGAGMKYDLYDWQVGASFR